MYQSQSPNSSYHPPFPLGIHTRDITESSLAANHTLEGRGGCVSEREDFSEISSD